MNLNRILKTSFSLVAAAFAAPLLLSGGASAGDNVRVDVGTLTGLQSVCTKNNGELVVIDTDNGDCQKWVPPDRKRDITTFTFADDANDTRTVIGNGGITTQEGPSGSRETTFSVDTETGNSFVGGTFTVEGQVDVQDTIVNTTGNVTVDDGLEVTGQTTTNGLTNTGPLTNNGTTNLNGDTTVNGNTTLNGDVSVANGNAIDMGDNRVEGVADPLAPTDAANKRYVDQEINKAFDEIDKNSEGIALAMAMSGLSLPSNANFAIGAQFGFFDDEQAFAAQGAVRLDQNFTLTGGVGVGLGDDSPVGGRIGVQAAF